MIRGIFGCSRRIFHYYAGAAFFVTRAAPIATYIRAHIS